jgi:hypothetical protein
MNPKVILSPVITAAFLSFFGCSTYKPSDALTAQEYSESLRVLTQICMSSSPYAIKQGISIETVVRYGNHGELRSVGARTAGLVDFSIEYSVFEQFSYERQIDLIAIMVNDGPTEYVFDISGKKLTTEKWTAWELPLSQNNRKEEVSYKLANQRNFTVHQPDGRAPKARFRLVRTSDWLSRVPRTNDDRPGC